MWRDKKSLTEEGAAAEAALFEVCIFLENNQETSSPKGFF